MFRLDRWKVGALLGTWVGYWVALVGVSLGPGIVAAWRLTHQSGSRGSMFASVDNGRLLINVNDVAIASGVWHFNAAIATVLAWIAVPPLALWLLWLVSRPRREALPPPDAAMLSGSSDAVPIVNERRSADRVERRR